MALKNKNVTTTIQQIYEGTTGERRKEMAMHICENAAKRITVRVVSRHVHTKLMQET
jgi:hypothetical protein